MKLVIAFVLLLSLKIWSADSAQVACEGHDPDNLEAAFDDLALLHEEMTDSANTVGRDRFETISEELGSVVGEREFRRRFLESVSKQKALAEGQVREVDARAQQLRKFDVSKRHPAVLEAACKRLGVTKEALTLDDLDSFTDLEVKLAPGSQTISPLDFFGFNSLTQLKLRAVDAELPDGLFKYLPSLKDVIFGGNVTLRRSHFKDSSDTLSRLSLISLPPQTLSADVFYEIPYLSRLSIENTTLGATLPEGIFDKQLNLSIVNLNGNGITSLSPSLFRHNNFLTFVRIIRNGLKTIPESLFDGLGVTSVDFFDNPLESLQPKTFDQIRHQVRLPPAWKDTPSDYFKRSQGAEFLYE